MVVNLQVGNVASVSSLKHQLKLVNCMESHNRSVGIDTVYYLCYVAVCIVKNRFIAVQRFHTFAVKVNLMPSLFGRYACLFSLNDSKRLAVSAIKHVVTKADTLSIRHTVNLYFNTCFSGNSNVFGLKHVPACLFEIQVDIELAGCRFAHIRRLMVFFMCACFTCLDKSYKVNDVISCKLDLGLLYSLVVFCIHSENADIMEGIYYVTVINESAKNITINKLKQGCLFGLIRV